jgi:hypothetical protein
MRKYHKSSRNSRSFVKAVKLKGSVKVFTALRLFKMLS